MNGDEFNPFPLRGKVVCVSKPDEGHYGQMLHWGEHPIVAPLTPALSRRLHFRTLGDLGEEGFQ